ncbi:hypothetical protein KIPB_005885, partial [Kipferlia bialata]|eukprot:g5885.t1
MAYSADDVRDLIVGYLGAEDRDPHLDAIYAYIIEHAALPEKDAPLASDFYISIVMVLVRAQEGDGVVPGLASL